MKDYNHPRDVWDEIVRNHLGREKKLDANEVAALRGDIAGGLYTLLNDCHIPEAREVNAKELCVRARTVLKMYAGKGLVPAEVYEEIPSWQEPDSVTRLEDKIKTHEFLEVVATIGVGGLAFIGGAIGGGELVEKCIHASPAICYAAAGVGGIAGFALGAPAGGTLYKTLFTDVARCELSGIKRNVEVHNLESVNRYINEYA